MEILNEDLVNIQEILSEILTPVTLPEELNLECYSINNFILLNYFKIGHFINKRNRNC